MAMTDSEQATLLNKLDALAREISGLEALLPTQVLTLGLMSRVRRQSAAMRKTIHDIRVQTLEAPTTRDRK